MIIAFSILAGLLAAWLSYRILFYDSSDFWDGCGKFTAGLLRSRRRWIWERDEPPSPPEYFEDESWSCGIRFFFLWLRDAEEVILPLINCSSVWGECMHRVLTCERCD